ncbi:MAG: ABC transporter ATP-binding protein [Bacillota bacterium]
MKKLFKFIKPYWKLALLAPLLMAIEVIMDLLQPRLIQNIIDTGIAEKNISYIFQTGLWMLGIAFLGLIGGVGCSIFAVITSENVGADLRQEIFSKIQKFSFKNINESNTGNLITVLTNDIEIFQRIIFMGLRILIRAPLMVLGSMIMAIMTSPRLSLIILGFLPIILTTLLIINKKVYPLFNKVQKKMDRVNSVVQENLAGIRVIKAFVRNDYEEERFQNTNNEYMQTNMAAARTMALVMPIVMLAVNLGIVTVIWFGGLNVIEGSLKIGQIVAFINYLLRLLFSMTMAGMMLIHLSRATVSADRITEVLEVETNQEKEQTLTKLIKNKKIQGKIEYNNVSFSYDNAEEPVLKDINFKINPGETTAIMGETGSGKSTLVRLIPRLYEVNSGKILIDDTDIKQYDKNTLRKQIGFILQETLLFSGTIRENIGYGKPDASEDEIIHAAKIAQAHQFIEEFTEGYNTKIEQRGVNLSGGQKQRIAIARALVTNPSILIFDDSTSAVDIKTEYQIMQSLKKASQDSTVIIIAQKISSVLNADKILLLEEGKITASGTHSELLEENQIYRDIYKSQYGEEEKYA